MHSQFAICKILQLEEVLFEFGFFGVKRNVNLNTFSHSKIFFWLFSTSTKPDRSSLGEWDCTVSHVLWFHISWQQRGMFNPTYLLCPYIFNKLEVGQDHKCELIDEAMTEYD